MSFSRLKMFWFGQPSNLYEKLDADDEEALESPPRAPTSHFFKPLYLTSVHLILLFLLAKQFIWPHIHPDQGSRVAVARDPYTYSKIEPSIGHETLQMHGDFEHDSIFRGQPRPELDAAWDGIAEDTGLISIDQAAFARLNKSADTALKVPEGKGGGYLAAVEVTHQLHCLNEVRKFTYYDYYKERGAFMGHEKTFAEINWHKDHCIDMLRQSLMCAGDTHLITYTHKEGRKEPYPDFAVTKVCRRYEDIASWMEEHRVPEPEYIR